MGFLNHCAECHEFSLYIWAIESPINQSWSTLREPTQTRGELHTERHQANLYTWQKMLLYDFFFSCLDNMLRIVAYLYACWALRVSYSFSLTLGFKDEEALIHVMISSFIQQLHSAAFTVCSLLTCTCTFVKSQLEAWFRPIYTSATNLCSSSIHYTAAWRSTPSCYCSTPRNCKTW